MDIKTMQWKSRLYDGDELRWDGYINGEQVAWLHRGGYGIEYKDISESDSWDGSEKNFFKYVMGRVFGKRPRIYKS